MYDLCYFITFISLIHEGPFKNKSTLVQTINLRWTGAITWSNLDADLRRGMA